MEGDASMSTQARQSERRDSSGGAGSDTPGAHRRDRRRIEAYNAHISHLSGLLLMRSR